MSTAAAAIAPAPLDALALSSVMGKSALVSLKDGREVEGRLWAVDRDGNLVLGECTERSRIDGAGERHAAQLGDGQDGAGRALDGDGDPLPIAADEQFRGMLLVPDRLITRVLFRQADVVAGEASL